MANLTVKGRIILRNDTKSALEASSIVLLKGEMALEMDDENRIARIKVGNGINTYAQLPYSTIAESDIVTLINNSINTQAIKTISLASGTNNGTVKITINGTVYDNIAVTGLGSAAYTAASAYATAAQGEKADNAMPKSGGTFTGSVYLANNPTESNEAATKNYVDSQVSIAISSKANSMVFKGTIGQGGTVTTLPTSGVINGDTYKVITALTVNDKPAKVGDLIIAIVNGANVTWEVIPAGDEIVTTVRVDTVGVNVDNSAKSGSVVLGMAATKQIATDVNSASNDLVTASQVKSYVTGLDYSTTDEHVKTTPTSNEKLYITGTTASTEATGTEKINTGVFINSENKVESSAGFKGNIDGTATKADELTVGIKATLTGGVIGTSNPVTGRTGNNEISVSVTKVNTDYLENGTKTVVFDCGDASYA